MNYELALKLKEAGFPQTSNVIYCINETGLPQLTEKYSIHDTCPMRLNEYGGYEKVWDCICPTLSELIEACGNRFKSINRIEDDLWEAEGYEFNKNERNTEIKGIIMGKKFSIFDKTPEEAVANLWLKLNEK